MILQINELVLQHINLDVGFRPVDIKEDFTMLDGGTRIDIINQKRVLPCTYDLIEGPDYVNIRTEWEKRAAVTVAYTDVDGSSVSFTAYLSPPVMVREKTLENGMWLCAQCAFAISEL